jgi:uncharacterized protein YceH (UPF0502 family)
MVQLNEVEARVLGALVEKEITTPEYYPLSLNALVNACNQKSNREPVMQLSEADVRTALFALDQLALVRTLADGRVSKFEHRFRDGLGTPLRRDEVAVLCLLLLRGPQTSAELRARSERLHTFEDNTAALATLDRLAQRPDALVVLLARQPGAREARWMHLLCGPVSEAVAASAGPRLKDETWGTQSRGAAAVNEELVQRVEALEEMVFSLEQRLFALEEAGEAKASE